MKFTNLAFIGLWFVNGLLSAQTQPDALIADGNNKVTQRPTAVFEENKGQMKDQYWQPRPDVLYYGNSGGMNYYIRNNGMSYQLSRVDCWKDAEDQKQLLGETKKQVPAEISTYRVDADWLGHNTDFTVAKGCELAGYNNYYNVPEGIEPALFVKQYEAVTLQNLWNGVDVHYYGTDGQLETDYLVAPSAEYRQIRMEIKGAELSVSADGHLVMKTPFGEIHEGSLKVYQGDQQVAANWIIMGNVVSFDIPNYDPCLALRIDPIVRVWGTYYGGDNSDYGGGALGLDSYNNVYMAGTALSINNIASGGHQNASEGDIEAFLVKFNSAGVRLWATYYGGYYDEIGYSCTVDINDNVYLCGGTGSDYNIATPGSHKEIFNAGGATYAGEAFLAKFNSSGIREWGTYFGGTSNDAALSCASDALGNIYLSGYTLSSDYIAFSGHQNTYSSGRDAFLAKFNASGGLLWASYYGGTGDDLGSFCKTDANNNVYMVGTTSSATNIASGGYLNTIPSAASSYLVKFNSQGTRQWATYYGNTYLTYYPSIDPDAACAIDTSGNVYFVGQTACASYIGFNGHQNNCGSAGAWESFIVKFDSLGARQWSSYYGGEGDDQARFCTLDAAGNLYVSGSTSSFVNIASDAYQSTYQGSLYEDNAFIAKFNPNGTRQWGTYFGTSNGDNQGSTSCAVDANYNIYLLGWTAGPNGAAFLGHQNTFGGGTLDAYLIKFSQDRIFGSVWQDLDADCVHDIIETSVIDKMRFTIQPGNRVAQSHGGTWSIDSLPAGTYTVTIDTTNTNWNYTCPITQSFTVTDPAGITTAPSFGLQSKYPCAKPEISINMPIVRRGFSNQTICISACNRNVATDSLLASFVDVSLDTNISVQAGSLPYTALGNNKFRVNLGTLHLNDCVSFTFTVTVGLTAVANQTLCMTAELFPQPTCVFDSIAFLPLQGSNANPCTLPYDNSNLSVSATCNNDSVRLVVYNTGSGNTACPTPILIFKDAQLFLNTSTSINSGDSVVYKFAGNNQTWHIQTAQHPLNFMAEPYPIASLENCGTGGTWTPGLINVLPQADVQPVRDIFCGQITAPFDPNDKTGYPLGAGTSHNILPNGDMEYVIRFQNVGTDTAFNIIVRDTLEQDLDILSVRSGTSSFPYEFRMYGQRILEWRFENIQLPDSTTNEPDSHGFVTFKVKQVPDLVDGTVIENNAGIYFDFEAPVITNVASHTIARYSGGCTPTASTSTETACGSYTWNGTTYNQSGTYTYQTTNAAGCDSTATLVLNINTPTTSTTSDTACGSYTWNGNSYNQSGTYNYQTTNAAGCDSTATLELTINTPTTSTTSDTACGSYTWNGNSYNQSGTYTFQTTNAAGCDSTATLVLTINSSTTSSTTHTACGSYTWNGQTYTLSDSYTYQTTNAAGCDSTATLVLTVESAFNSVDTIAGPTLVDTLQTYTYSIPEGNPGDSYLWGTYCGTITIGTGVVNGVDVVWENTDSCLLWVERSNATCRDTLFTTVFIDFGSGINESLLGNIALYPNPTNGLTSITWGKAPSQTPDVTLLDALGRTVPAPIDCQPNGCTIDVRYLPAGVYTVLLMHQNGAVARKLIKTE